MSEQSTDGIDRAVTTDELADAVDHEIDECERLGFLYLVGDGDDPEVKLP